MKPFKEWFEELHGLPYPANKHESVQLVWERLADAIAEYLEEALNELEDKINDPTDR